MNFLELSKNLKTKIEPVYIIKGDDEFLIEKSLNQLLAFCGNEFQELNQTFFDDENYDCDKILDSLNQMPFASDRRLVVIKNIAKIPASDKEKFKKYFENVNPQTTVVIVKSQAFDFVKNQTLIDCKRLSPSILYKFIVSSLNDSGKKITQEAIQLLMEYCSYDMTRISQELKKFELYDLPNNLIEKKLIEYVVTPDEEYAIFELTDALGKKQGEKAIKILNSFLEKKEPIQNIFALISNNFRRVIFSSLSDYSDDELAEMFKVKPYAMKKARESSRHFSKPQLKKILELLENVDYMIKSGEMQGENAIYFLVFSILNV